MWVREFFDRVCGWMHGVRFVFMASQNTMAALIEGFTLHSFHRLNFEHKDGTTVVAQKEERNDVSSKFLRYQALRFMFIDEFSTGSIDVYAEIHHDASTHIRSRGAWALRRKYAKRPFGGLSVIMSGDAWQFWSHWQ